MRQLQKPPKEGKHGKKPREPLEEGIIEGPMRKRYSEDDILCLEQRRRQFIAEGKMDIDIGKLLAGEMGRPVGSVSAKISRLVKSGEFEENPNNKRRKKFTEEDIEFLERRRKQLIPEGKNDTDISRILAGEMGKIAESIRTKLCTLCKSGELEENPNKETTCVQAKKFTEEEIELIQRRRKQLISEGKNNTEISRILAGEMGRSSGTLRFKFLALERCGSLDANPNRDVHRSKVKKPFSEEDLEILKRRRTEFISEGKNDAEISRFLSGELGRTSESIRNKINLLCKSGKLAKNPNRDQRRAKSEKFTENELELLKKRRNELILKGKKDTTIGKIFAAETGRSPTSVVSKISILVKRGELAENPNKQGGVLSLDAQKAAIQEVLDELERFGGRS